jgi:hypothetical protein
MASRRPLAHVHARSAYRVAGKELGCRNEKALRAGAIAVADFDAVS